MKKIILLGGAGTIGAILAKKLQNEYKVIVMDKQKPNTNVEFIPVDATNYNELFKAIPGDADTIVNLLRIEASSGVESVDQFNHLTNVFFQASYYVLMAAREKGIHRVVFASSNHVTDGYEEDGYSLLSREITVDDFPKTKCLYGVLKFASEQLGHLFAEEGKLSVINLRIASVPAKKKGSPHNERLNRTLLSDDDLVSLVRAAIETETFFGTYYGVSNHLNKPWSTLNAYQDLGFLSNLRKETEEGEGV
ncbi:hypothetical protein AJ85_14085 [Alkalihalobacillus alcalophilus ATCC 27647 = CGMCC 1.3604]|uniref:NAD-dependent epimerase/dehydratase domain-containing protein n=1 Tax=Alkalihalobacillus alcalophilus ATCC 27647 = CGMCC 1.3604 TaxID=1218173 RepID=A0A094WN96_ALKAL|nr:NAD(P)-dependent oxidoreductase [Alkalihalobacillus alcalophilus]KGA97448.1 hypothetical protein BALCAV_0210235 [Alkalihalobacillus alcalophilus ATCC 27647 = CGMCC 1.3604]MED1562232.1 NAD(P)-dependent oxidoreductase [Alkalihalobacillus alcalophilus]THG89972.1 hypothetical protein AJ85_14085 [Alkalihalobacillus alcalophilus ATCC 27647 = CGMCC 1.3604]